MSVFPIEWQDKINDPQLLAFLQQFGPDKYLSAEEINQIRDALNELHDAGVDITQFDLSQLQNQSENLFLRNLDKFSIVNTNDSPILTGTTANTILVSDVLIPAGSVNENSLIEIDVAIERTIITSGNTGISICFAPNAGITDPTSGSLTSIYKYGGQVISSANRYVNLKLLVQIKDINTAVVYQFTNLSNVGVQGNVKHARTANNWSEDQYFYIYVNNVVATTETFISSYAIRVIK